MKKRKTHLPIFKIKKWHSKEGVGNDGFEQKTEKIKPKKKVDE